MSTRLRIYSAAIVAPGVSDRSAGSIHTPYSDTTLADGATVLDDELVIAPDEMRVVWRWGWTHGFDLLRLECDGYLRGKHRIDAVTSPEDETPLDDSGPWNHWSLSCIAPFTLDSDRAFFHATAAIHVGGGGDDFPGAWGSGEHGVVSAVAVWNPGDEPVKLRRFVVQ